MRKYLNNQLQNKLKGYYLLAKKERFNPLLAHLKVKDVTYLKWSSMKQSPVKYVVFDKENTLTEPESDFFKDPKIKRSVRACQNTFGIENVAVISDSTASINTTDLTKSFNLQTQLGMGVIQH